MTHPLALHQLCLMDVAPVDLPGIAREAGLSCVSVFVTPPSTDLDIFPMVKAGRELKSFVAACRTHDVRVHNLDCFSIGPETDFADLEPALDVGAEIGARRLTALVQDPDAGRAAARMAQFAQLAQARGIAVSIEFMMFSKVRSIEAGAELVSRSGHNNLSLLVDVLHLIRTGGNIADLKATDARLIGAAQICDGPLDVPEVGFGEALHNRGIPGEGEFPLPAFLAALPTDCPVDIEAPLKRLADRGVSPLERAQRLIRATNVLLAEGFDGG